MLTKKGPSIFYESPTYLSFVYFTSLWIDPHVYMLNIYLRVQSYTKKMFSTKSFYSFFVLFHK